MQVNATDMFQKRTDYDVVNAITIPDVPPISWPTMTSKPVRDASNKVVFSIFPIIFLLDMMAFLSTNVLFVLLYEDNPTFVFFFL